MLNIKSRILFFALLVAMVLFSFAAHADIIESTGFVDFYINKTDETPHAKTRVPRQESTLEGGWYYIYNAIHSEGAGAYVRAVSVNVIESSSTNETATQATATATPNISLPPGVTPSPTPLAGTVNPDYTGTVINYTVPVGGLMLYDAPSGKQVESAKAGTVLKLTLEQNESWYSLYFNGKTYYVPVNSLYTNTVTAPNATMSPSVIGSIASVMIDGDGARLYSKVTITQQQGATPKYSLSPNDATGNYLQANKRVNARYYSATVTNILVYTGLDGKTYYFSASDIDRTQDSTATVAGNDSTNMMTVISFQLLKGGHINLYRENSMSSAAFVLTNQTDATKSYTLYGERLNSDWYKVTYNSEIFYVRSEELVTAGNALDVSITNAAVNQDTATDTFMVTIGSGGGRLYKTIPASTAGATYPPSTTYPKLPAGSNVLVGPYNALWYIYTDSNHEKFYLYRPDVAEATSTTAISSYKATIYHNVPLYDSKQLPTSKQLTGTPTGSVYVLYSVDDKWYSVTYDGASYYVLKVDMLAAMDATSSTGLPVKTIVVADSGDPTAPNKISLYPTNKGAAITKTGPIGISVCEFGDLANYDPDAYAKYNAIAAPTNSGGWRYITPDYNYLITHLEVNTLYAGNGTVAAGVNLSEDYRSAITFNVPTGDTGVKKHKTDNSGASETIKGSITFSVFVVQNDPGEPDDALFTANPSWDRNYYAYISTDRTFMISNEDKSKIDAYRVSSGSTLERIANVSDGKDYYVTIGLSGAQLYTDASLTTTASLFLRAGETVNARKYTDRLYIVSGYYLSVKDIASIRGGDDAAAVVPTAPENSIADVAKGVVDTSFEPTVLSYVVPSGGLWLYYNMDTTSVPPGKVSNPALVLDAGKTIKLNAVPVRNASGAIDKTTGEIQYLPVYSVWYGGVQYYVPSSSLTVSTADTVSGGTYSILITALTVDLYKKYTAYPTTTAGTVSWNNLSEPAGKQLERGMRVNVSIQQYVDPKTKTEVHVYRYVDVYGNTYYFYGNPSSGKVNDDNETFAALVASNADVNLMSKLVANKSSINVYTSPSDRSGFYKESSSATSPFTLYGVKYDSVWYRVIYNDKVGYVKIADMDVADQVVVTDGVSSTTYTVIIGTGGAKLYTKPSTNMADIRTNGVVTTPAGEQNRYTSRNLQPGEAVLASRVNTSSGWYACTIDDRTLYFMNNTTTVSNENTNASVSSYIVDFSTSTKNITLYASISDNDPSKTNLELTPGVYTFRKINNTWSSVYYNGKTYYLKNSDIPTLALQTSTAIATTSVGNTYTITLSNKSGTAVTVYSDSTLKTRKDSLPNGTKTTGVKMYVEKPTDDSKQLVFRITYLNGAVGYVNASDVIGVQTGDEVAEARLAEQEASQTGSVAVGQTVMHRIEKDELLYQTMSLTATTTKNMVGQVYELTKVDASWYSLTFSGVTWYYPASNVSAEKSDTGGTQVTVSVGESYLYTFTVNTDLYAEPVVPASRARRISSGETHTILRVNEDFYQVTINDVQYYILATDITLPFIPNTSAGATDTSSTQMQHDGTGYITSYLMIQASSGSVNLRKSTSTSSTVLDRIPNGVQVKNNGYVLDANKTVWYSVTYNNQSGFVHGDYVSPVGSASTGTGGNPANDIGRTLTVNMNDVNVRSGPGPSYSVLTRLPKGYSVVPLTYETGKDGMVWYSFKLSASQTAYIRYDYLDGSAASSEQSGNVAVKAGGTNLRSGPGETFGVVARLARDIIVTIIGTGTDSSGSTWYYVTYEGMAGYLRNDLVRPLTESERSALQQSVIGQYIELRSGSKGAEVLALQQQLIKLGYLSSDSADGVYGTKTVDAVKAFQKDKGLTQTGVATASVQATIFNTPQNVSGSTKTLDWFSTGFTLINANKSISVFDINAGITWSATYINGANHADIIPASKAEADKIKAYNITGSYVRRPVIVTIAGQNYAGSMYAVGHGSTSYCSYFHGVMCIHFTGSKTHGSGNVDSDHQSAIKDALSYANSQ